jgi:hypothetical protein
MSEALPNVNRLGKWRTWFAGWQLGTRPLGDPECDAIRDHREATLIQRAELSALVGLLIKKGVFTAEEFTSGLEVEAAALSSALERRWPGVRATDEGLALDVDELRLYGTMNGWKP